MLLFELYVGRVQDLTGKLHVVHLVQLRRPLLGDLGQVEAPPLHPARILRQDASSSLFTTPGTL